MRQVRIIEVENISSLLEDSSKPEIHFPRIRQELKQEDIESYLVFYENEGSNRQGYETRVIGQIGIKGSTPTKDLEEALSKLRGELKLYLEKKDSSSTKVRGPYTFYNDGFSNIPTIITTPYLARKMIDFIYNKN